MNYRRIVWNSARSRMLGLCLCAAGALRLLGAGPATLLNDPVDVSGDFRDVANTYYLADSLGEFDPGTHSGKIRYKRAQYYPRQAFDNMLAVLKPVAGNEFPENEYAVNPPLPFSIECVSPRTIRIRATSGPQFGDRPQSLMLAGPVAHDDSW